MKDPIKKFMSFCLTRLGRFYRLNKVPILTYHSIDQSQSIISVGEGVFRSQMQYLFDQGYQSLPLKSYLDHRLQKNHGRREFILTFDDGFLNNHTSVFPILREFGFSATFFLTTGYVGKTCPWQTDEALKELPMMGWPEIEEMQAAGFDIGAHTVNHPDLTRIPLAETRDEVAISKAVIEDRLGSQVALFCYPYGKHSPEVEEVISESGFSAACTTEYGIDNSYDGRYRLNRIGTAMFKNRYDFEAGVLGSYGLYVNLLKFVRRS